ncbi:transcription factor Maf [Triticum aestivum]|uniref:transcription factor Maf n=1 Tax=Triticum aestivum TaxID=4565 RepID=UPI001D00EA85|nr:transcription factor Maf-like [Triticum aestivum]
MPSFTIAGTGRGDEPRPAAPVQRRVLQRQQLLCAVSASAAAAPLGACGHQLAFTSSRQQSSSSTPPADSSTAPARLHEQAAAEHHLGARGPGGAPGRRGWRWRRGPRRRWRAGTEAGAEAEVEGGAGGGGGGQGRWRRWKTIQRPDSKFKLRV